MGISCFEAVPVFNEYNFAIAIGEIHLRNYPIACCINRCSFAGCEIKPVVWARNLKDGVESISKSKVQPVQLSVVYRLNSRPGSPHIRR